MYLKQRMNLLPVSAPGSAGMETCFVNLINKRHSHCFQNGVFGGRMKENVIRCGAKLLWLRMNGARQFR